MFLLLGNLRQKTFFCFLDKNFRKVFGTMFENHIEKPSISISDTILATLFINFLGYNIRPDDRLFFYIGREIPTKMGEFIGMTLGSLLVPIFLIFIVVLVRKFIFKKERNMSIERKSLIWGVLIFTFLSTSGSVMSYQRKGSDCVMTDLWGCRDD